MRLTGVATGNAIEAGFGGLWGEDPRYSPSLDDRSVGRVRHAAAMVFIAHRADGHQSLVFARYTGIVGGNFISNTWRVPSESTAGAAITRSVVGFLHPTSSMNFGKTLCVSFTAVNRTR